MQPILTTRKGYREGSKRKRDVSPCTNMLYRRRCNFNATEYKYESLKTETSIRLLQLQPGEKGGVQCHLSCVERDLAPPYEALSYLWGGETDKRIIDCGNGQLRVPVNLRDLLNRLLLKRPRGPIDVKFLWADAICINQDDKQERGHQVKNMGLIYAKAERVLVWLGSDGFEDFDDFDENTNPHEAAPFAALIREIYLDPNRNTTTLQSSNAVVQLQPEELDPSTNHAWTTLAKLLCHPWFSRVWVVQEVGMSKSALALFGENEMDFDDLMVLASGLVSRRLLVDHFGVNTYVYHPFSVFPARFENIFDGSDDLRPVNLDFLEVLQDTRTQEALDPRDYIYALLGHPSALIDGELIVEPDYNKSAADLFHEIAIKLIIETNSLRVLSAVRHQTEKGLEEKIPSWIPTWDREVDTTSFGVDQTGFLGYDAAAGETASWDVIAAQKVLRAQGIIFAVVDEHTRVAEYSGESGQLTSSAHSWPIHAIMSFNSRSEYSVSDRLSELAQTLASRLQSGYLIQGKRLTKFLADFAAFRLHLIKQSSCQGGRLESGIAPEGLTALQATGENGNVDDFLREVGCISLGRKFFSTRCGMLGLGPRILRGGDLCCVLFGAPVPFILRPHGSQYRLVGEAYIHGAMFGEVIVDWMLSQKYKNQAFEIF
jgi:hypothetical protein